MSAEFLHELLDYTPDGSWFYIWRLYDKISFTFQAPRDIDLAYRTSCDQADTYLGVALAPHRLPQYERVKNDNAAGILSLWSDVDIRGPMHKKMNLPPDREAVLALLDAMPLKPTVVIDSGHGCYPWWFFKEPWIFGSDDDRKAAQDLESRWEGLLHSKAFERSWQLDSTHDLARVLRLPGTLNAKDPANTVPVQIIFSDYNRRYDPNDFLAFDLPERCSTNGNGTWKESIGGVTQGDRNVAAASIVGKFLASLSDIGDRSQQEFALSMLRAWDAQNKPPLGEKELQTVFGSILKAERQARQEREKTKLDTVVARGIAEAKTVPPADPALPEEIRSTQLPRWHLAIKRSKPVTYLLRSPWWFDSAELKDGYLPLTAKQLRSWKHIGDEAMEHAHISIPPVLKGWLTEHLPKLLADAPQIEALVEEKRNLYLAAFFFRFLRQAVSLGHDDAGNLETADGYCPILLDNGTIHVKLEALKRQVKSHAEDFLHSEIMAFLAAYGQPLWFQHSRWWSFNGKSLSYLGMLCGENCENSSPS